MKHVLIGLLLLPAPALAWQTTPIAVPSATPVTAASSSSSSAVAQSRARATSSVTVTNSAAAGSPGGRAPARAPDVSGAVYGGNTCAVGGTIGGSGPGAGGLLGFTWEANDCTIRQEAALMANLGRADVALQILCNDPYVADAMARVGTPCARDVERWKQAGWKGQ
jgi:hypothetical protein